MIIETVAIELLSPDPANLRLHPNRNINAIAASLVRFGQQHPVVVDRDGVIRAGNGTYLAAKELDWRHLNVVWSDLAGSEATAYAIADNRSAELAEWDTQALGSTLRALQAEDLDLKYTGFTDDELDALAPLPPAGGPSGALGEGEREKPQALRFALIFDSTAQQTRWFYFINRLSTWDALGGETLAQRLDNYLVNGGFTRD
jgi:ParB-like chromosome segregation protein Spo0J